jgi:hypothetical protein
MTGDRTDLQLGVFGIQHLAEAIGGHASLALRSIAERDRDRFDGEMKKAEKLAGKVEEIISQLRAVNEASRSAEFEADYERRYAPANEHQRQNEGA